MNDSDVYAEEESPNEKSLLSFLLDAGAQVNQPDPAGNTPGHQAADGGDVAALDLLLKSRADLTITNQSGQTIMDIINGKAATQKAQMLSLIEEMRRKAEADLLAMYDEEESQGGGKKKGSNGKKEGGGKKNKKKGGKNGGGKKKQQQQQEENKQKPPEHEVDSQAAELEAARVQKQLEQDAAAAEEMAVEEAVSAQVAEEKQRLKALAHEKERLKEKAVKEQRLKEKAEAEITRQRAAKEEKVRQKLAKEASERAAREEQKMAEQIRQKKKIEEQKQLAVQEAAAAEARKSALLQQEAAKRQEAARKAEEKMQIQQQERAVAAAKKAGQKKNASPAAANNSASQAARPQQLHTHRVAQKTVGKSPSRKAVESWSLQEVQDLLGALGLEEHCATFEAEDIDGSCLVDLEPEDFIEIGMQCFGEQRRLHNALERLKEGQSAVIGPPSVHAWTVEQVKQHLMQNSLPQSAVLCAEHRVNGDALLSVTKEDIRSQLEVQTMKEKKGLEKAIEKLRQQAEDGVAPAPSPCPYVAAANSSSSAAQQKVMLKMQQIEAEGQPVNNEEMEGLCCPLSLEPMTDPVIAADGHTYERIHIHQWLSKHNTSPMTNEVLENKTLIPNHVLKALVAKHAESGL